MARERGVCEYSDRHELPDQLTDGFMADSLLFSERSPEQLFFRVGMPAEARLVQVKGDAGAAEVLDHGATIATVVPPSAKDAGGTPVPISMSASGNMLQLSVSHRFGEYRYPIEVDPAVLDVETRPPGGCYGEPQLGNWVSYTNQPSVFYLYCTGPDYGQPHALADVGGAYSPPVSASEMYDTRRIANLWAAVDHQRQRFGRRHAVHAIRNRHQDRKW